MSYEQLPQAFRQSRVNTRSITLDGIGRFALSSRTTAKVINQHTLTSSCATTRRAMRCARWCRPRP